MQKRRNIFFITTAVVALFVWSYIKYHNMNINDIGLKVLSFVKKVKGDSVNLGSVKAQHTAIVDHQIWSQLLKKHVDEVGKVNYNGFIQDRAALSQYLDLLSNTPPGTNWTEADQLAYWINAYNAFTVKLIIDHYPLESIKDIGSGLTMINSPWDLKFFKIGGVDFDLNTIEHEILRKRFEEPRIHFAINCASFSCPKLRNEAFKAQDLETQLADQTFSFINNSNKNIINAHETKLSQIFDWFKSDFTKKADLLTFVKGYNSELDIANEVEYIDYNWSLNN